MGVEAKAPLGGAALEALLSQREAFRRFLAARVGSEADAEDILQDSLLKALQRGGGLRRGESVIPWFYRLLRNAVVDFYRGNASRQKRIKLLFQEFSAAGENVASPTPADWDEAVCHCFQGLLPSLKPRYAELVTRVDLRGESKILVRHDLKLSTAAFDVALHRARNALRERLELFCGACSREACIACACEQKKKRVRLRSDPVR